MLVQAELVGRFERRADAFLERTDRQLDSHAHELVEFRATVTRVLELLERFISRRSGGNGL
jgi:hypothetical protein